jgi:hypothetical protein
MLNVLSFDKCELIKYFLCLQIDFFLWKHFENQFIFIKIKFDFYEHLFRKIIQVLKGFI